LHGSIGDVEVRGFPVPAAPITSEVVVENARREAHIGPTNTRDPITAILSSSRFASFKMLLDHGFHQNRTEKTKFALLKVLLALAAALNHPTYRIVLLWAEKPIILQQILYPLCKFLWITL